MTRSRKHRFSRKPATDPAAAVSSAQRSFRLHFPYSSSRDFSVCVGIYFLSSDHRFIYLQQSVRDHTMFFQHGCRPEHFPASGCYII